MVVIRTDVGDTIEEARRIRFEPNLPFTATNVQDAIQQGNIFPKTILPTVVTGMMSPYAPSGVDTILLVDTTAGPVTINLPPSASRNGLELTIKDGGGHAATNVITIVPNGAETIDGINPAYLIDSNYAGVKLGPQDGGYFVDA